jgi:DNA polymerase-3 subunit epsilon
MAREIIVDTETTGLDHRGGHRLIEIAAVELDELIPTGRSFHRYIDPERDIDVDAERVHGLSGAFLRGKPKFADFDRDVLNAELERAGRAGFSPARWTDTLAMAQQRFPGMYNSLDALCKRFKISLAEREKHGALIDCKLLANVYLELKGGRERVLDLQTASAVRAATVVRVAYGARLRPLALRSTDDERVAHAAFILKALGEATLWLQPGWLGAAAGA